ncbi:hypothetical protein Ciccas_010920 [Cichlidogyrus casuarinus]|uniref:Uncharacterized protein n=1 Tax=Cichlidogyrus casuarinus TaxID=1844966 RepID=A0ABD2PSR5_9PLAT
MDNPSLLEKQTVIAEEADIEEAKPKTMVIVVATIIIKMAPDSTMAETINTEYAARPPSDNPDRPRISIQPRSIPVEESERKLSERSQAIFGTGKPREASPIREKFESLSVSSDNQDDENAAKGSQGSE